MDGLIWLRTGHQVAAKFNHHQTTVSRNSRKCAKAFGISLERVHSEWQVIGDRRLLNLERRVHQHMRFKSGNSLRLDAQHWSGSLLGPPPPSGWILGNLNFQEYQRPLQLMQERIIDAWITSYPDGSPPIPMRLAMIQILPRFGSARCPCSWSFMPATPY